MVHETSDAARRARLVTIVGVATILIDWSLKAIARATSPDAVVLHAGPPSIRTSVVLWLVVAAVAAVLVRTRRVNSVILFAYGLGAGAGLANEAELRLSGHVTDFIQPPFLPAGVYAPADLAMCAAVPLMFLGSAVLLMRAISGR